MFASPRLTQIYPLHAPPSYPAPTASETPLPALKHPYLPLLIYPTLPISVTYCYMWNLGNLPGRSLPLYKYALSWQTRDISYIILAYKAEIVTDNGGPFRKAVKWLELKYGITGIVIIKVAQ